MPRTDLCILVSQGSCEKSASLITRRVSLRRKNDFIQTINSVRLSEKKKENGIDAAQGVKHHAQNKHHHLNGVCFNNVAGQDVKDSQWN